MTKIERTRFQHATRVMRYMWATYRRARSLRRRVVLDQLDRAF